MKWLMRMLGKAKKDRHGFTLIELMIVLIIVAILAVAAVPTYTYFVHRAYESEATASLGAVNTAEIVHYAEHMAYAGTWDTLGMTTLDFTQNKWFSAECFALTSADNFTVFVDGSNTTIVPAQTKVVNILLWLKQGGDVAKWDGIDDLPAATDFLP